MSLAVHFAEIADPAALEPRWRALEARAGERASFFLGWGWIGNWLEALRAAGIALPQLVAVFDGGREVALATLGHGRLRRRFGAVPALWLNQCGDPVGDRPFVEYNGLLCAPGLEEAAARAVAAALAERRDWRALLVSGVAPGAPLLEVPGVRRAVLRDESPACFVDLTAVRAAKGEYLALLGANTRRQIRRSLREEPGVPVAERAPDAVVAGRWLDEMARLNAGRHRDEAWEDGFFRDFARRLVLGGLADGSVDLLRIACGEGEGEALGYVLTLLRGGRAMNYQSAFAPPRTPHSKPGLMSHAAAVARYAAEGREVYSFLAGKDRYKRSLSTDAEELQWWTLERYDLRLEVEAAVRALLRR